MQKAAGPIDVSGLLPISAVIAHENSRQWTGADIKVFSSHRGRAGLCDWQLKRVVTYLSSRIDSSLRVSDLASEVNLSPGHFARAFAIRLGMSPYMFFMKLRIDRARTLLLTTEKPLAEIAFNCGLADQAHFSRLFRRFEGVSPSQFRRQQLEENKQGTSPTRKAARTTKKPSENFPASIPAGEDFSRAQLR